MAVIPVVLRLSSVASNYNLCFTLTTPGVAWSMGDGGDNYVGISCNALTLDSKRTSCIQRIAFSGPTLMISTGPSSGSDFELTAFIDAPDDAAWLQGFCILNEKARVSVRLGDLDPVEWRGEINCAIPILLPDIHRVTLSLCGIKQGQFIRIEVADDGATHTGVRWCAAPLDNPDVGLAIRSSQGGAAVPIAFFHLNAKHIDLTIGATQRAQGLAADLIIEAYIERFQQCRYCPPPASVRMKMECDESVMIAARVGNHLPQSLGQAYKLFAL